MKNSKTKKILSLLLTLVMLVGMIPATSLTAFAAAEGEVYVGGVGMSDGDYLAVGATATQTTKPSGGYAYYKDGTLTLNNYSYEGEGYKYGSVYARGTNLTIELLGDNTLVQTQSGRDAICADGANLTIGGTGNLTCRGGDHGIWVGGKLTINGGTITAIGNTMAIGYYSSYGFSVAEGLTMQASTTVDGELGEYVAENHDSYKKIVIAPALEVYVGGVGMYDGTYLAVGATATQTTKPSGGYAYYKDGTLTLNNYSYEGKGYLYNSSEGWYATVYAVHDLTVELVGTNTLKQTASLSEGIRVGVNDSEERLTIQGGGSLNVTSTYCGILAWGSITVNGGTIISTATDGGGYKSIGICSEGDHIIINGGNVTVSGDYGLFPHYGYCEINGGTVTATGIEQAIINSTRFTVAEGLKIQASTTVDGALGEYVAENHDSYKKIVIAPALEVYVGGVGMYDGTYLAVGATATQTTKPSGGYAYYKDGTLTLNNYSYEGEGYKYGSVYARGTNLTIELLGDNTLVQTQSGRDAICADGANLTIGGTGNLTCRGGDHGIWVGGKLTINGGTITAIGSTMAIGYYSSYGFFVAEGLTMQASTTVDGALGEYVAGNNNSYKKIVITGKPINNINVSATFSGTPAKATTSTTGATVTATKWYKKNGSGWTELGTSDTIKEGGSYRCEVTIGTTGTYTLADGYTVKINGIDATKKSGNTWYRDVAINGYTRYVDVYDIALPEAFTNPDFTYNDEEGAAYHWDVVQVKWFECDKDGKKLSDALTENDVFKKDTYYRIEVTVVPETNWQFHGSDLSFYINDKLAMPIYGYNKAYPNSVTGYVVYHVDDANGTYTVKIGDVTLKDGDYLANNATSVTTVKPVGGYAYYKDGVLTLNNFVAAKLVRYYERYLEVELIGENKIGAIADYYYWDTTSNNYYTGLEFRGDGDLEFDEYYDDPCCNVSVNGDVFFNGSGDILLDAEFNCFQYTDNVIINDGYVYCYCSQFCVFGDDTNITVNGGKLKMYDGGSWYDYFICDGDLLIYAGSVYVSTDSGKTELADCVPWDGVTDLNTYECVWIVEKQETILNVNLSSYLGESDFITLALYDKNMDISYYHYTLRGNTTSYSFPAVPYGEYVIVAEKPGHVPYQCTIVAEDDALYQNVELNLYADTNLDGEIDENDYQALVNAVLQDDHEQIETEEYDDLIHYDLVMDGYLDVLDAAVMALVVNGLKTIDEVYDIKKGDYDYDGEAYTESDLIAMYHVLSDIDSSAPTLSTSQKFASDLNYNGKVDEGDLAILTGRYGTIESTTCEENIKVYYRWGNSYTTCTATAICTICDKHVAKETVNSVKNADGSYTATFTNTLLGTKTFKKQ